MPEPHGDEHSVDVYDLLDHKDNLSFFTHYTPTRINGGRASKRKEDEE